MTVPAWNTLAAFATERTTEFGKIQTAIIKGSYLSYNEIHPGNVEVLDLNIEVRSPNHTPDSSDICPSSSGLYSSLSDGQSGSF